MASQPTGHPLCLGHDHVACNAKDINLRALEGHLILDHNVSVKSVRTKGEYGRLHMLTHAVMGSENLLILLGLPENYGTGRELTTKY
jgi:hypothetical protein